MNDLVKPLNFILLGDTVNTAARMERYVWNIIKIVFWHKCPRSNGIKNKVQVSEQFAAALEQVGKLHWLVERPDKIQAKGKGLLQTYWLNLPNLGSETSSIPTLGFVEEHFQLNNSEANEKSDLKLEDENPVEPESKSVSGDEDGKKSDDAELRMRVHL